MVGRLVHQQQVGARQQQLGESDAHLPAAGELLGLALLVGEREAEPLQDVGDARIHLVATEVLEALGDVGIALEQLFVRSLGILDRQLVLDLVLLRLQRQQLREREHHLGVHGASLVDDAVLRQVADGGVRCHANLARVRLFEAREHAQQCRLARAVRAGQADAIALLHVPGHVLEEHAFAVPFGEAFDVDHGVCKSSNPLF